MFGEPLGRKYWCVLHHQHTRLCPVRQVTIPKLSVALHQHYCLLVLMQIRTLNIDIKVLSLNTALHTQPRITLTRLRNCI